MNSNYKLIIELEAVGYNNPSNCVLDLRNILKEVDYIKNIKLINAEKLKYNTEKRKFVKTYYDYSKK